MRRNGLQQSFMRKESIARATLCLYFIISIFEPYLNGILGSVTKYYMFFVMLVLLWKDGFRLRLHRIMVVYVVWLVYKIVSLLWSEDIRTPQLHFISQVGMVLYMAVLLSAVQDRKTLDSIKEAYWLSSIVLGVLSLLFSESYHGTVEARQVLVIMGVEVDPNNQAALLLVGVAISASNILYEKRRLLLSIVGLVINVYACFGTSSRAALITAAVLAICCILYAPEKRKFRAIAKRALLVAVAIVAVHYLTVRFLPGASFKRLFDFETYEGGSKRDFLWQRSWEVYMRHPLTVLAGSGWGTVMAYINGKGVHNSFLSMLCDVGLFGTLLFLLPLVVVSIRLLRRKQPMPVMLLGAQLIPAFFIDAINKRFFWNAILLLILYYLQKPEEPA